MSWACLAALTRQMPGPRIGSPGRPTERHRKSPVAPGDRAGLVLDLRPIYVVVVVPPAVCLAEPFERWLAFTISDSPPPAKALDRIVRGGGGRDEVHQFVLTERHRERAL